MKTRFFLVIAMLFYPGQAFAYVDPGLLSSLYQIIYAILAGAVFAWIAKPWNYLKSLSGRKKKAHEPDKADNTE